VDMRMKHVSSGVCGAERASDEERFLLGGKAAPRRGPL